MSPEYAIQHVLSLTDGGRVVALYKTLPQAKYEHRTTQVHFYELHGSELGPKESRI